MTQDLDKNASQATALRTLDARNAANTPSTAIVQTAGTAAPATRFVPVPVAVYVPPSYVYRPSYGYGYGASVWHPMFFGYGIYTGIPTFNLLILLFVLGPFGLFIYMLVRWCTRPSLDKTKPTPMTYRL